MFRDSTGQRQQGTLLVSVPEDAAPEDVTLQVTTGESEALEQSVSLLDGTRLDTGAPQLYEVGDWRAEVVDAEAMELPYERLGGQPETIRGEVAEAYLTPYTEQFGWSRSGELYLVVDVDEPQNHDNHSAIHAELPDGTVVQPQTESSSLLGAFDGPMTFAVPADAGGATVVLTPRAKPRVEVIEGDPAEASIAWEVRRG